VTNSMPYLQRVQELGERGATQPRVTQQLFSRAGQETRFFTPKHAISLQVYRISAADEMRINLSEWRASGKESGFPVLRG